MNYIWEPLIKMMQQCMDLEDLHYYVQSNSVSPYLELQGDSLYEKKLTKETITHIDVNPYLRFQEIFEVFITPDHIGYTEFNLAFSDTLLHYLANIDLKMGMSKREYYIKFIIADMENGALCSQEMIKEFTVTEKRILAGELFNLYQTSDYIGCLMNVIYKIMPFCQVLMRESEEIIFYMREVKNNIVNMKLECIIKLFLPIHYDYVIHWMKTYGLIGWDDTMEVEEFII